MYVVGHTLTEYFIIRVDKYLYKLNKYTAVNGLSMDMDNDKKGNS